jgi:sialic acid synthase SpsE
MRRTLIIAEPGSTPDGNLNNYLKLIAACADAGADVFKVQWVSDASKLCVRRRAWNHKEAYQKIAFPEYWHHDLYDRCKAFGMSYGCTTYVPHDLRVVADKVDLLKVASFEANDLRFIRSHMTYSIPLVVSTGMMHTLEVESLVKELRPSDILLHCTSSYPLLVNDLNLQAILSMQKLHPRIGLSDHCGHPIIAAAAVTLGAVALEVHVRLEDADPQNADYKHSLTPWEFGEYVKAARFTEVALGSAKKSPQPCELSNMKYRLF